MMQGEPDAAYAVLLPLLTAEDRDPGTRQTLGGTFATLAEEWEERTLRDDMRAAQVRGVLADTLGVPATLIHAGCSPDDMPLWHSLHHFTLVAALGERFEVIYSSEEIPAMTSMPAIVTATAHHLGARGEG